MRLVNWMMDNRLIEAFTELEEETTGSDKEASVFKLTSSLRASSLKSPEPSTSSTSPTASSIMTSPASASTLSKAASAPASVLKNPPAPEVPTLEDAAFTVRECLDTNAAFPSGLPPQAYGMILLELLENLVPEHVEIGDVYSREDAFEVWRALQLL